jgi:hypothetical protein
MGTMGKTWVLDTETKGTGAQMVPLEKVLADSRGPTGRPRKRHSSQAVEARPRRPKPQGEKTSTPLPAGHVRKKATGEIGRVRAVDAKAGTATVLWLKQGRTSTVPLTAISRR